LWDISTDLIESHHLAPGNFSGFQNFEKYMNAYLKYFLLMTIFSLNTVAHIICMSKCFVS